MLELKQISGILDTKMTTNHFDKLKNTTGLEGIGLNFLLLEYQNFLMNSQHALLYFKKGFHESTIGNEIDLYSSNIFMSMEALEQGYVQKIEIYNKTNHSPIFFNGITELHDNDIIITIENLSMLGYDKYNAYYDIINENQIAYISFFENENNGFWDDIYDYKVFEYTTGGNDPSSLLKPIDWKNNESNWNTAIGYFNDYFNNYYHETYNYIYLKTLSELKDLLILNLFSTLSPVNVAIDAYGNSEQITFTSKVVGFIPTDTNDYNPKLFINESFLTKIGIDPDAKYSSAIAYNSDLEMLKKVVNESYSKKNTHFKVVNEVTETLDEVNDIIVVLSNIFLYVGIGFAVFASLLLINYIGTIISYKKQEIGILRAIGARGKDVSGIFLKEAIIIALINFFVASIIIFITIFMINNVLRTKYDLLITILSYSIRQVGLMLIVSLFVAYISSSIPVRKISRKRPIDAIRDK